MKQKTTFLKPLLVIAIFTIGIISLKAQTPILHYNFSGNLDNDGSNGTSASSTYGAVTYVNDADGNASSAYLAPTFPPYNHNLVVTGYKGIGGDNTRTVSALFKTSSGTGRKSIISWGINGSGTMFNVMVQGGQARVEAGQCSLRTTRTDLMDDKWHHIAVTYDPADGEFLSNVKVYLDGVLDTNLPDGNGSFQSTTKAINTDIATEDVIIGRSVYRTDYMWEGELDDIRVYSEALSASEISGIYSSTLTVAENEQYNPEINVYPNPATNRLSIKTRIKDEINISVYNVLGGKVKTNILSKNKGELLLDISQYSTGIYMVSLASNTGRSSFKFVKQ